MLCIPSTRTIDTPVPSTTLFRSDEDTLYNGQVTATDVDGEPLTYALAPGQVLPAGVTFNSNGTFSVAPLAACQRVHTGQSRAQCYRVVPRDGTSNAYRRPQPRRL